MSDEFSIRIFLRFTRRKKFINRASRFGAEVNRKAVTIFDESASMSDGIAQASELINKPEPESNFSSVYPAPRNFIEGLFEAPATPRGYPFFKEAVDVGHGVADDFFLLGAKRAGRIVEICVSASLVLISIDPDFT